uniref:ATP synthase complex subunit 8 n=1 Tax=Anthrenus sp. BMNH 840208 TaxID=904162 RepID=E3VT29_9COLE|nr:ATP synthase F0 subunit 8 [Anthrenus sp. BMNH 840208]
MPQMAPMNWLSLFLSFSFLFMMTNSLNFFSSIKLPLKTMSKKGNLKLNWKW